MVRINLLPPEILQRRKSEKLLAYVLLAAVALVAILVVIYGVGWWMVAQANKDLQSKLDQTARTREAAEAFAIFEAKETELSARRAIVETALAQRMDWARLITEVSLVLPQDQWVQSLLFSESDSPGFEIEGWALDPEDTPDGGHKGVASTLVLLADLPQLQNVWLTSSEKDPQTYAPRGVIVYSVTADIIKPAAPAQDSMPAAPAPPPSQ